MVFSYQKNKPHRGAVNVFEESTIDKLDYVLIKVSDLEKAIADFKKAGFKVYPGEQKDYYNAMVYFSDDSFIELVDENVLPSFLKNGIIASFSPLLPIEYRKAILWAGLDHPFIDYAVHSSDLAELRNKALGDTTTMTRTDSKGTLLEWQIISSKDPYLPFVISDYTPHKLPETNAVTHTNGVQGISSLYIHAPLNKEDLTNSFAQSYQLPLTEQLLTLENATIKYVGSIKEQRLILEGGHVKLKDYNIMTNE